MFLSHISVPLSLSLPLSLSRSLSLSPFSLKSMENMSLCEDFFGEKKVVMKASRADKAEFKGVPGTMS